MGQCKTLDIDVTIGCYYSDYSSCDNTIPTSLLFETKNFPSHLFACLLVLIKLQLVIVK